MQTPSQATATFGSVLRNWLLQSFVLLGLMAVLLLGCLVVIEGTSRVAHWGVRPMTPIQYTRGTFPAMFHPGAMRIAVPEGQPVEYLTNDIAARISDAAAMHTTRAPKVVVLGDSQALGWGLNFEATVGARVAKTLFGSVTQAQLLASAAVDPELALYNLAKAKQYWRGAPQLLIVYVNFGNDLDEAFLARAYHHFTRLPDVNDWLSRHSYAALDIAKFTESLQYRNRAGINDVLFRTSSAERQLLVDGIVHATLQASALFGPQTRAITVVIPNDYQFELGEFAKYRRLYSDAELYAKYQSALPTMRADMNRGYQHCIAALRQQGLDVVDVMAMHKTAHKLAIYDDWSHHLNALGNRLVAEEIVRHVGPSIGTPQP